MTTACTSRFIAVFAICTVAAFAVAAPQGDHRHDDRDHKDQHAQDKGRDHHQDQGRDHHGDKHRDDQARHHDSHQDAVLRHKHELEIQREIAAHRHHHHPVVVITHGNDDWKQIAVLAGLVAVVGLVEHDKTLVFVGAAGALYSWTRYEHDRHSHNRVERLRALYFSRPYFYRNGHRYRRVVVKRGGQRYYRFVR